MHNEIDKIIAFRKRAKYIYISISSFLTRMRQTRTLYHAAGLRFFASYPDSSFLKD